MGTMTRQAAAHITALIHTVAEHSERLHHAVEAVDALIDAAQAVATLTGH